jgi:putative ABC transport system substrate-binding protein
LGWVEGENLAIEWRFADGLGEVMPDLAGELVRLPVEVLVAAGALSIEAAYQATSTIPIVMVNGPDPAAPSAPGMLQSLARPGTNVTGNTAGTAAATTKSVELLKTLLPHLSHLAILTDKRTPADADIRPYATSAAQTLGVLHVDLDVPNARDVESVFEAAQAWGAEALYVIAATGVLPRLARICELAARSRLPGMYVPSPSIVTGYGALMAYGPSFDDAWRKGADYVDKILHGAKPADLPVEDPRTFDFVVNVKAAQELGLVFPPDVAAQVTHWIQP